MSEKTTKKTQNEPTEAEQLGIKGPVKEVLQARYVARNSDSGVKAGKLSLQEQYQKENFHIIFDKEGNIVSNRQYYVRGVDITNYQSKKVVKENIDLDLNRKQIRRYVHEYDEQGRLIELKGFDSDDKPTFIEKYRYNEQNKIVENANYRVEDMQHQRSMINEYDSKSNLIKSIHYNADKSVNYTLTKYYNEAGLETEHYFVHEDPLQKKYSSGTKFKYNEQGDVIEHISLDSDGNEKNHYYYDRQYDENGKQIKPKEEPELNLNQADTYRYDKKDNWINRTVFNNKTPIYVYWREFIYWDDPEEKSLQESIDLTFSNMETKLEKHDQKLTADEIQWLAEAGNIDNESFSVLRYYAVLFKDVPSIMVYQGPNIEAMALKRELQDSYTTHEVHSHHTLWDQGPVKPVIYSLVFPEFEGYLLHAYRIQAHDSDDFQLPGNVQSDDYGYVYIGQFHLLRPSEASGKRVDWFESELYQEMLRCTVQNIPEKPRIHIVETNTNGFIMKQHSVSDSFEIKDLDLNYGQGFKQFHEDLMYRFNTSKKGLVLFHGQPGTGKTYYIRHLLRSMVSARKVVIYMPPNMVDHLTDPNFMTFLIKEVRNWSADGFFCVLLIEDAEPLLAKRQEGVRIQGVTNLLNMTDGLLNDMLQLQIICTFNVDLRKLDSALLRPGRLLARKEFKALDELDANLLAQRLGIKHHFTKPATLSEIYAMKENQGTLIHDVEQHRDASDAIDDL